MNNDDPFVSVLLSNMFNLSIKNVGTYVKNVTMTTNDSHHGALQNFPFFFTVNLFFIVFIFVQSKFNIL